jgi:hypothetical protein
MSTEKANGGKSNETNTGLTKELKLKNGEKLLVPDHWKIERIEGNMAYVTDGKRTGRTPIKDHGISFKCSRCESYGPWNGIICLSCGQRSDE